MSNALREKEHCAGLPLHYFAGLPLHYLFGAIPVSDGR